MDDILSKPYALEDCTRLLRRWLAQSPISPSRWSPPPRCHCERLDDQRLMATASGMSGGSR